MAVVIVNLKWLKGLLCSLGGASPKSDSLFCDSQYPLQIAQNSVFHEHTKHIEIDCHFVRDGSQHGTINPSHVSFKTQLVDISLRL